MACIFWLMSMIKLYTEYGWYYLANVDNKYVQNTGLYYLANVNNKYIQKTACVIWLMSIINIFQKTACVIWLMSINICRIWLVLSSEC